MSLRELVDIALQALAQGSSDATSAYEAIHYLGAIMHNILLRDMFSRARSDAHGRRVVYNAELDHADYVGIAIDRIRQNGATYPASAAVLLTVSTRWSTRSPTPVFPDGLLPCAARSR